VNDRRLHSLLSCHGLELDAFISIDSTACRTPLVQVLLDVVPAETTDLEGQ
jgi:hypothetical protein